MEKELTKLAEQLLEAMDKDNDYAINAADAALSRALWEAKIPDTKTRAQRVAWANERVKDD